MKGIFICFVILISIRFGIAQVDTFYSPDFKAIELATKDSTSSFFYKSLLDRFYQSDTTFTIEEKRALYYGAAFQDSYNPYGPSPYIDSLKVYYTKDSLTKYDYLAFYDLADSVLLLDPFNIKMLNYQLNILDVIGSDSTTFFNKLVQFLLPVDAILSSGDGVTQETAYYVTHVDHEYAIIEVLGFTFGGAQSLMGDCDKLTLETNEFDIEAFYFNVATSLNYLNKIMSK